MQEAELIERVEHLFAEVLTQTYQRDGLIDLYHALRRIWRDLARSSAQDIYRSKLCNALRQIESAGLWSQQNCQLTEGELAILGEIKRQFAQLEEQAHF